MQLGNKAGAEGERRGIGRNADGALAETDRGDDQEGRQKEEEKPEIGHHDRQTGAASGRAGRRHSGRTSPAAAGQDSNTLSPRAKDAPASRAVLGTLARNIAPDGNSMR